MELALNSLSLKRLCTFIHYAAKKVVKGIALEYFRETDRFRQKPTDR